MNNEYIVVAGGAIVADSSQQGPARRAAESAARSEVGAEVVLYKRVNVYKARVVVEDDSPTSKPAEEAS
jgi:hypothetical protein